MTRYLDFSRLASRSEYWGTLIITWLLAAVLSIITISFMILDGLFVLLGLLIMISGLVLFIWIALAVTAARCRDAGINPWWTAATFIPYIGLIIVIVIGCISGRQNTNL